MSEDSNTMPLVAISEDDRPVMPITCIARDVVNRQTKWAFDGSTLVCTQYSSPEPWHILRHQSSFCTVTLLGGREPEDFGTSSHATAVSMYIMRNWRGNADPILTPEYDV